MRWAVFVFLVGCPSPPAQHVDIPTPLASASVAPVVAAPIVPSKKLAAIHVGAGGAWAAKFPAAKTFKTYDPHAASQVVITWHVGAYHAAKPLAQDDDYPANHVALLELEVGDVHVNLGEMSGSPVSSEVSFCKNLGFKIDSDAGWGFPQERNIASAFTMSIAQGSDDYLLVRDVGTLHLLHRQSSDGKCDEGKQGPLDICEGADWSRIAELHIGAAELFETIAMQDKPFDCTTAQGGLRLVFP
jgi:hypothetical protein